jgi:hypothetical protein
MQWNDFAWPMCPTELSTPASGSISSWSDEAQQGDERLQTTYGYINQYVCTWVVFQRTEVPMNPMRSARRKRNESWREIIESQIFFFNHVSL